MSASPAEPPETGTDVLAVLDRLEEIPLADQVEVFQTIHDELAARLSDAEG